MRPAKGQSIPEWIASVAGTWRCKVCGKLFGILDPGNPNGNYAFGMLENHFNREHKPEDFFEKMPAEGGECHD